MEGSFNPEGVTTQRLRNTVLVWDVVLYTGGRETTAQSLSTLSFRVLRNTVKISRKYCFPSLHDLGRFKGSSVRCGLIYPRAEMGIP